MHHHTLLSPFQLHSTHKLELAAESAMNGFYSSIAHGLDALHGTLASSPDAAFMSAPFLQQAAALLRSLHSQLVHLVQRLHLPPGESWLDEYMDETSRLWDACQVVKAGASALDTYCASAARIDAALDDWLCNPNPHSARQVRSSPVLPPCACSVAHAHRLIAHRLGLH